MTNLDPVPTLILAMAIAMATNDDPTILTVLTIMDIIMMVTAITRR